MFPYDNAMPLPQTCCSREGDDLTGIENAAEFRHRTLGEAFET